MSKKSIYKRALLKISGEALSGPNKGIDFDSLSLIADEILEAHKLGVELGIVIGGGNIFRGASAEKWMDRVSSDYMGMLATCINALALQEALEKRNIMTRVQTAIQIAEIAEPYIRRKALRHLEKGRVVIFAGGTGNPYFTTDTTAALRAMEIDAEIVLKATQVDGIYEQDPATGNGGKRFDEIKYIEVLDKRLKLLDSTSISLCMDNKMPLIAFKLKKTGNIVRVLQGEKVGTKIQ